MFLLVDFFFLKLDGQIDFNIANEIIKDEIIENKDYKNLNIELINLNKSFRIYEDFANKCAAKLVKNKLTLSDTKKYLKQLIEGN